MLIDLSEPENAVLEERLIPAFRAILAAGPLPRDPADLEQLAATLLIPLELPGMPAEVYIKTTERTFFEYLMQPIRDSMARAFRES